MLRGFLPLPIYRAIDFRVSSGVAIGEPVLKGEDVILDDVYRVDRYARPFARGGRILVTRGDCWVKCGAGRSHKLICCLTLMDDCAAKLKLLVFENAESLGELVLVPLSRISHVRGYRLIDIDMSPSWRHLAGIMAASFGCGTKITLACGRRVAIEQIAAGDQVLTRDSGPQPVWDVAATELLPSGSSAAVRIPAGAFVNQEELILGATSKLHVQPGRKGLKAGPEGAFLTAADVIKLVADAQPMDGYFQSHQLLFRKPQIVFAEGIQVLSSLMIAPDSAHTAAKNAAA